MKTFALLSLMLGLFAAAVPAAALEFSPYGCYFLKMGDSDWKLLTGQSTTYVTKMDWNQTSAISKSKLVGNPEAELGICSEVSSTTPEETFLNIYLVDGQGLDFESEGCLFSGNEVKVTRLKTPVSKNPQSAHVLRKLQIGGVDFALLHVAGLAPAPVANSADLCDRDFKEIFPDAVLTSSAADLPLSPRLLLKKQPGDRL